jgi:hypothetical protein
MKTIQEARDETELRARAEAEIANLYPNTCLTAMPGGQSEWTTAEMLDDATHITLLGRPHVHVALSVTVEGVEVHHPVYVELDEFLQEFSKRDNEGYQRLVTGLIEVIASRT